MNEERTRDAERTGDERFRILFELSDVTNVDCFVAEDRQGGEQVILRDAPNTFLRSGSVSQFENEVRLLSGIRCETYSQPLACDVQADRLRLVYRFLTGDSLAERIRRGPLTAKASMRLARDLFQALSAVHRVGCVHRDVRSSNIMIQSDGKAVLCGYGPLWRADLLAHNDRLGRESASYASPELSGIIDHDVGPTSDLYSLGLIVYAALTGGPPFSGDVSEILFQHLTSDPDSARYPRDINNVVIQFVEKLTQKEPRDRYQSSQAALFDAEQILTFLESESSSPGFVIGNADQRTELIDPAFVGRHEQIEVLQQSMKSAQAGDHQQILMVSPSGMGKTRLLNEATRLAARQRFLILHGKSSEHAGQEPNAPWLQMIDQFSKLLRHDTALRAYTAERMEGHREEVNTAMPDLASILGWQGRQLAGPDELGQGRVISAFRTLITGLGSAKRPVMLTLDDCQWLDDQSTRVLAEICDASADHLLLLAVARPAEGISEKLQRDLNVTNKFFLGPLSDDSVGQLAESMAGQLPQEVISVVRQYADGSPFMAAALLRGMVESEVLIVSGKRWQVDHEKLSTFQAAEDASEILVGRLAQLPAQARNLIEAAAVIGKEFQLGAAAELAGVSSAEAHTTFEVIRKQRLVWSKPNGEISFVHDKIRETILAGISDDVIKSTHGLIGRHLEESQGDRVFELAYHFDAAKLHREALPYALRAAEAARKSFSLASAERQLQIAVRAIQYAEPETKHHIEMMMSDVLMLQGEYDRTDHWLDQSAKSAVTDLDEAKVALKRGELFFKRGNKDKAVEHYEDALRRLGQPVCNSTPQLWWNLTIELLRQARNTILPSSCGRKGREPNLSDSMTLSLYSRIAHAYWYTRDKYYTLWAHLRGMNGAEQYQPTKYLAQSYSEHAPVMTLLRWQSRGDRYAKRSLEIRQSLDDVWGQGQSRNFMSILLYSFSRFESCIEQAQQAVAILERTGDFWEVHIARYQLAASLYRIGELDQAVELAQVNYRSAIDLGDYQATGNIIAVWARAALGAIPEEIIQAESDRDVYDPQRICQVKLAHAVRDFYQGRYAAAAALLQEAITLAEDVGVINTYISPCYPWLATALRKQLETDPPKTSRQQRRDRRRLLRVAKRSLSIAKNFTNELPHALREYGAACAMAGRRAKAKRLFERSLTEASQQHATLEHALTVVLRDEFAPELNWTISRRESEAAADLLSRFRLANQTTDRGESLSLLDRFDSLLEAGRRIATSVLPQDIFQQARSAAQRILRGEHIFFVLPQADSDSFVTSPEAQLFDHTLVDAAQSSNTTVIKNREAFSDRGVVTERKGTFLCSPIHVHGETVAYLYLANTRITGLYSGDEIRIVDYLSSAAGAALEKADGFQQLRDLNQNLEKKVQQRTAAVVERSEELEQTANQLRAAQLKLENAKQAAEAANDAKSEFLARMSHEIRTPITAVLGFTELLLRGVISEEQDRTLHLETIHSNGAHLLNLLNDILDISKIEADRIEVEQISCVPARIVGDVVKSFESKALEKNVELNIRIADPIPEKITSDPTRLRQIVTNLVGNAIKFTDRGAVNVMLGVRGEIDHPSHLEMTVNDSGIGMTPAQMAKIFDPFAQADTSTTRKYGGTGLGLAISKRLAEALGGSLEVSSEPGVGSDFKLTIALNCPADTRLLTFEEAMNYATGTRTEDFKTVDLGGTSVLVVDDGETNRELISLLLCDAGADVRTAVNGQEAVECLTNDLQQIDVVLMDMQMPVLDGYSAARQLRANGFSKPIIALTANTMAGDDAKCRESGCTDYLPKPIDFDALLAMVRAWSQRSLPETDNSDSIIGGDTCAHSATRTAAVDDLVAAVPPVSESPSGEQWLPNNWLRTFACELVDKVTEAIPGLIRACQSEDLEELGRQAHWIKGSGGTVGLDNLSSLAGTWEHAVHEADLDTIRGVIAEMQEHLAEINAERLVAEQA